MTRKPGDAIAIGGNVVVKVIEVQGGKVQLGIEAPRELKVEVRASPASSAPSSPAD